MLMQPESPVYHNNQTTASVARISITPAMRTSHGAQLLAVVLVVLLSSGIWPAAAENVYPPEYTCFKVISSGFCSPSPCQHSCSAQLRGEGHCVSGGCQCRYYCNPPPTLAPPPADI
ncbi:hypothetical protein ACP70R_026105 [Stipagrostis hirtigluma subsp. patula]